MSLLLPDGIDHLGDLPHPLFDAIRMALGFLQFDELPKDERPPRSIWLDSDRMSEWWKAVERQREAKYGLPSQRMSDEPIDGPVSENDTAGLLGMTR